MIDVLAALREQDTRLDDIIRDQQVAKGRGDGFNPRAFAERVQVLGPLVSLDVLQRHVGSAVLNRLGTTWDERYGELVAFKSRQGHCHIPADYAANPPLGAWLVHQRQFQKRGTLSEERVAQLQELGVVWDVLDDFWERRFQNLARFKARHGHCNVAVEYPDDPLLGTWLNNQRRLKRRGALSPERVRRLTDLGLTWDVNDAIWEQMAQALAGFKTRHGHCNVPQKYSEDPRLGTWLAVQRRFWKRGALSADRIARLEALGVVWDAFDRAWEQRFQELAAFRATRRALRSSPRLCQQSDAWTMAQQAAATQRQRQPLVRMHSETRRARCCVGPEGRYLGAEDS